MNLTILKPEVQAFINQHLTSDITKLVLKGSPFEGVTTKELVAQIEAKKKCLKKLPNWFHTKNIYYPNKLNIEQTSSEATANYKAELIQGNTIIDVTGGFGVDCLSFAKHFDTVTHCEINTRLSDIAKHNAEQLGVDNVLIIKDDGIEYIAHHPNNYDWIYIDPSRRNDVKGKVFLLKDCLPNVPLHLDVLLEKSHHILIKNSPLIDITSCVNELKHVKEVVIIALQNEVKEVLVHVEKAYIGSIQIKTINIAKENQVFDFTYQQNHPYRLSEPLNFLYEPNSAILKSGGFTAICQQFNVYKLHQHSHLYTANCLLKFPGRVFKIVKTIPYHKKQLLKEIPDKKANITTRNFKESVASIRKKTGIKEGGDIYLFFTTNSKKSQIVIVCKKT